MGVISAPLIAVALSMLYVMAIAPTRHDALIGSGGAITVSLLTCVYFYRRRALFHAGWRWAWAERWWPGLAGSGHGGAEWRAGFTALSPWARRLFVVSLLLYWIV